MIRPLLLAGSLLWLGILVAVHGLTKMQLLIFGVVFVSVLIVAAVAVIATMDIGSRDEADELRAIARKHGAE